MIKDLAPDLVPAPSAISPADSLRAPPPRFTPPAVFPHARSLLAPPPRLPHAPPHHASPTPHQSPPNVILQETTRIATLLCVNTCPVHAIHDRTVTQKLCRGNCEGKTAKGYSLYVCNACRRICPNGAAQTRGLKDPGGSGISVRGCTR